MSGALNQAYRQQAADMARRGPAYTMRYLEGDAYTLARHVRLINDVFVDAATHGNRRVILSTPPRHSKSETSSVGGPVWFLSRFPHKWFAVASYGASLARGFGRRSRNYIAEHGANLGVELAADSREAHAWSTTKGGGFIGVGVGGAFTGKGADFLVVDDPIKDAAEAFSPTIRENVWNWWLSVASTRLHPGASVFLVMTRWHSDDLVGRVLREAQKTGEQWTEVRLPALCNSENDPLGRAIDEPLWPERYSFEMLDKRRRGQDWTWPALYQQEPLTNAGGSPITMDDLPSYTAAQFPDLRRITLCQSWDPSFEGHDPELALRAGAKRSRTGGMVLGFDGGRCYVLDHTCEVRDFLQQQAIIKEMRGRWPNTVKTYLEFKANGAALAAQLGLDIPGIIPVRPAQSKFLRLCAVAPFFKAHNVWFPPDDSAPWVRPLKERLCAFPSVEYDDDIDALTQAIAAEWLSEVPDESTAEYVMAAQTRHELWRTY